MAEGSADGLSNMQRGSEVSDDEVTSGGEDEKSNSEVTWNGYGRKTGSFM